MGIAGDESHTWIVTVRQFDSGPLHVFINAGVYIFMDVAGILVAYKVRKR